MNWLWLGSLWRKQWHPTPVLLPGKSHRWRSLVGCSPWGCKELDKTERLHFPFSLSCIGEENGNLFQCPCLENPRDGGAWWAAVSGVTQSRTRLKWLSSSSSSSLSLLQQIFLTQKLNQGLLNHRQILYQRSYIFTFLFHGWYVSSAHNSDIEYLI